MKIIKNVSSNDLEVVKTGVLLAATTGQKEIDPRRYAAWGDAIDTNSEVIVDPDGTPTSSTLQAEINAGNLVVNNGTIDLNAVEGSRYLTASIKPSLEENDSSVARYIKTINIEGNATAIDEGDGKVTINVGQSASLVGKLMELSWYQDGSAGDKYMKLEGCDEGSNRIRGVVPFGWKLVALTFSNHQNNADGNFRIQKNGTTIFTWSISNKRRAYKTNGLSGVTFIAGDNIRLYGTKGNDEFKDPVVVMTFIVTDDTEGEGSA
jgi:hypothetical protein